MPFMLISFILDSSYSYPCRIACGGIGEGWGVEHCKNAGEGRRWWRCQIINGTWEYLQPALYGGDIAIGDQLLLQKGRNFILLNFPIFPWIMFPTSTLSQGWPFWRIFTWGIGGRLVRHQSDRKKGEKDENIWKNKHKSLQKCWFRMLKCNFILNRILDLRKRRISCKNVAPCSSTNWCRGSIKFLPAQSISWS